MQIGLKNETLEFCFLLADDLWPIHSSLATGCQWRGLVRFEICPTCPSLTFHLAQELANTSGREVTLLRKPSED